MKLYDMRRETVMREARNWFAIEFNPQSADDVIKVAFDFGSKENAYFRQITSFWEMSASLMLHGAVHEQLFMDWSMEMIFVYSKLQPFLGEIREKINPNFLAKSEKAIQQSGREELVKMMLARMAKLNEMRRSVAK